MMKCEYSDSVTAVVPLQSTFTKLREFGAELREVFHISFSCASHQTAALCRFHICVLVLFNAVKQSIASSLKKVKYKIISSGVTSKPSLTFLLFLKSAIASIEYCIFLIRNV